jgi:hypothetical protein
MKDAFHIVPASYDDDGFPIWGAPLTPTANTKRAMILAPPDHVIPVIFVPGIMGSNLKVKGSSPLGKADDIAWRPDVAGVKNAALSAAARQQLLDPDNTLVDKRVTVNGQTNVVLPIGMSLKGAESRGWGSVYWKSYGDVLTHLDLLLNSPCFYDPTLDKVLISARLTHLLGNGIALPGQPTLKLERAELEHMSQYWFPVHAVGYNWLQSNEDAGKYLAQEIERIISFYQQKLKHPKACQQVIVITHSMGGLVARAAIHPSMGKAAGNVMGIVHGVMPAIGAAAAYRRMRAGFERGEIDWFSLGSVTAEFGGQAVAGRNGRDVTAVLGHAPGGLQLLPNKAYHPEGWLKMAGIESEPYVVPLNGDPYTTIYREQKKWWRLINPEWLDPAHRFDAGGPKTAWGSFDQALRQAEYFHERLGHHYHPNTYCFHGADAQRHPSYGTVTWKKASSTYQGAFSVVGNASTNVQLMKNGFAFMRADDATGRASAELNHIVLAFEMTNPVEAGDGTVPAVSGAAPRQFSPACVRAQIAVSGIDHQGAYATSHETVMSFISYSVCKIAKSAA